MTFADRLVALLTERGPQSRTAIEAWAVSIGWSEGSVARALWVLKRQQRITHIQRPARGQCAIYGIGATP